MNPRVFPHWVLYALLALCMTAFAVDAARVHNTFGFWLAVPAALADLWCAWLARPSCRSNRDASDSMTRRSKP